MPDQPHFSYTGLALVVHLLTNSSAHAYMSGTNETIAIKSPADAVTQAARLRHPVIGAQILDDWEMTEVDATELTAMRRRGPAPATDAVRLPMRQAQ